MLVWACIAPHGGEIIPDLATQTMERMAVTRESMTTLGKKCEEAAPETIVVMTPHGEDVAGFVSIMVSPHALAILEGENGVRVTSVFDTDIDVVESIVQETNSFNVPVAFVGFDDDNRPQPIFMMDWGAYVPLWFMGANWKRKPKVVVVCCSRSTERNRLVDFGKALARAAEKSEKRIAIICSADQGHGHLEEGPYGFSEGSEQYDTAYCNAIIGNSLKDLLSWESGFVELAFTDSYCQTLALHGVSLEKPLMPELLSYEAPTYFGLACAEFRV